MGCNIRNKKGFSLVEMIVVVAIFIVIIMITTNIFDNLLRKSGQQTRSAQGDIAGIIGLELMRGEIANAGFGLPWSYQTTPAAAFTEVNSSPLTEVDSTGFNEIVPRAVASAVGNDTGMAYLVVKSAISGMGSTAQKWSFLVYSSNSTTLANLSYIRKVKSPDVDWKNLDRAIIINPSFFQAGMGTLTKQLVMNGNTFFYKFNGTTTISTGYQLAASDSAFLPTNQNQIFMVYKISDADPRMPYNRADFYVDRVWRPESVCNPGTGTLFKAVANSSGGYDTYPLLDCVGDMQVVYFLDMDDDGNPQTYYNPFNSSMSSSEGATVASIQDTLNSNSDLTNFRQRLKSIQVYVLAQEGKLDRNFSYPVNDPNQVIVVGPPDMPSVGRVWTKTALSANTAFRSNWNNYRWKVYSFTVKMGNLQ